MANEEIKVNDNVYKVTINDQTRMYAMKLNRLYQQGFNDVDSFDEISSEISTTINNLLKNGLSPEVQEEDMDGAVKQLLHMFDKSKKWVTTSHSELLTCHHSTIHLGYIWCYKQKKW